MPEGCAGKASADEYRYTKFRRKHIMAESMLGLKRSHRCTELSTENIGENVTVMGWVQKSRNKGGIIFVDLRDRSGLLQIIFEEADCGSESFAKAEKLRSEFVIAVTGKVEARSGAVNENLKTGAIEIRANALRILSESETPPFPIEENSKTKEELRLKYRYLDLRRPDLQKNLMTRSRVTTLTRAFLAEEGFLEIETPTLIKSTPEGARDYLVPSRVHPGSFYALPQSPQLFKQLLMCSGYDRYFQIARCYRDEDLRADRQPEFTQIDMELSFVDVDDVLDVNERLLKKLFKEICGFDLQLPIQRMTWREAMDRFGSDKPDLRFGMELKNVSETVKDCQFVVFKSALENGGSVRGINAEGQAGMPRKKIDALVEFAKGFGAKGLAYLAVLEDGSYKSSFAKFMTEEELAALVKAMDGKPGDLLLFAADKDKVVFDVLGNLRLELARQLDLLKKDDFKFLWVTEFPLLEYSEEQGRFVAMHHPFTMPMEEDLALIDTDPGAVRAKAYDIVLNGTEMGGGSVRIHQSDIQSKMFEVLGFTKEQANEQFGFLLEAFKYGVPPHAGLAYGLDRMVMLMVGADSIRDVIAFPKVKDASCLMTEAPSPVDEKQLKELGIEVSQEEEQKAEE
ncbi:aspartate--tRNA ligase [Clostridium sp. M62/1]|nr:aspartate--tRNA ligase [Clostridium sp. M62/1]